MPRWTRLQRRRRNTTLESPAHARISKHRTSSESSLDTLPDCVAMYESTKSESLDTGGYLQLSDSDMNSEMPSSPSLVPCGSDSSLSDSELGELDFDKGMLPYEGHLEHSAEEDMLSYSLDE